MDSKHHKKTDDNQPDTGTAATTTTTTQKPQPFIQKYGDDLTIDLKKTAIDAKSIKGSLAFSGKWLVLSPDQNHIVTIIDRRQGTVFFSDRIIPRNIEVTNVSKIFPVSNILCGIHFFQKTGDEPEHIIIFDPANPRADLVKLKLPPAASSQLYYEGDYFNVVAFPQNPNYFAVQRNAEVYLQNIQGESKQIFRVAQPGFLSQIQIGITQQGQLIVIFAQLAPCDQLKYICHVITYNVDFDAMAIHPTKNQSTLPTSLAFMGALHKFGTRCLPSPTDPTQLLIGNRHIIRKHTGSLYLNNFDDFIEGTSRAAWLPNGRILVDGNNRGHLPRIITYHEVAVTINQQDWLHNIKISADILSPCSPNDLMAEDVVDATDGSIITLRLKENILTCSTYQLGSVLAFFNYSYKNFFELLCRIFDYITPNDLLNIIASYVISPPIPYRAATAVTTSDDTIITVSDHKHWLDVPLREGIDAETQEQIQTLYTRLMQSPENSTTSTSATLFNTTHQKAALRLLLTAARDVNKTWNQCVTEGLESTSLQKSLREIAEFISALKTEIETIDAVKKSAVATTQSVKK